MPWSEAAFLALLGLVALSRLVELHISRRHQFAMARRGIRKRAEPYYPGMVALHAGVLAGAALEVILLRRPFVSLLAVPMAALFALATALRWWAIRTMGLHWNVQVMPSAPLGIVTGGPFRWVRHPNYLGVSVELIALPLIHTAWITALFAAVGNSWVLYHRLRAEEAVLNSDPVYRAAMARKPRFLPKFF